MNNVPKAKPMPSFEAELRAAREIALAAGRLLRDLAGRRRRIRLKGPVDLVTEADLASEKLIVEELGRRFPAHAVMAEETARARPTAEYIWLVDPLDGTTNYAHGFPIYAVSIGLLYRDKPVVGVIYDPNLDELFTAISGDGALLNDRPISVSSVPELDGSLMATGFPYHYRREPDRILQLFRAFSLRAQGMRRAGAASIDLACIACGRFDGYWELGLKPWDTAAGSLIVAEAGGRVTGFDGTAFDVWQPEIVASNGLVHQAMLDIIRDAGAARYPAPV